MLARGRLFVALVIAQLVGVLGWVPAASAQQVPPVADRSITVLGDSVLLRASDAYTGAVSSLLGAEGWKVDLVAYVGMTTATMDQIVREGRVPVHPLVAVALGNNDGGRPEVFEPHARSLIDALVAGGARHIMWLTLRESYGPNVTGNQVLRRLAAERPDLIELLPWDAEGARNPSWFAATDRLHLNPSGARAMASLILDGADGWWGDVNSHSACGPATNPAPSGVPGPVPHAAWALDEIGQVHAFGAATFGDRNRAPIPPVDIAPLDGGTGYWLVDPDGTVHSYGAAPWLGDLSAVPLNRPVTALVPTPDGWGYWLVSADGGVFTFGSARFYGSTGAVALNAPVVALVPTPTGRGYWLVAGDGGVFTFGDAAFQGSTGGVPLVRPVFTMASAPGGYRLVARDGGVFTFGSLGFLGSLPGLGLCATPTVVDLAGTRSGGGYWVLARDGRLFPFGDAPGLGDLSIPPGRRVVALAVAT